MTHVRVFNGELKAGHAGQTAAFGQERGGQGSRQLQSRSLTRARSSKSGETGYMTANIKSPQEVKMGDTITDARQSVAGAAGLQGNSSDGVQRHLPDQHGGLRASQGRDGQAAVERFGVCVSGGNERGAGVWLPLRVPRPAASGDRAGTPAPRIRHGHHRDLSERHLSRHPDGRHGEGGGQPGVSAGSRLTSKKSRSRWSRRSSSARTKTSAT